MKKLLAILILISCSFFFSFVPKSDPSIVKKEFKLEVKVKTREELKDIDWLSIEETLKGVDPEFKKRIVIVVEEYKLKRTKNGHTPVKFTTEVTRRNLSTEQLVKRSKNLANSLVKK